MKAVVFVPQPGGATVEIQDLPAPRPAAGEALISVRAAGLNRGEMIVRRALTSGPPQQTGIEFAGEVAALGAGAARFKIGDRVMGHWRGGQAELVAADERLLVPVPPRLSWTEAGAWLNVFVTAHDAIATNAELKPGESILINAASSGIGVAALQIARLLGAKPVIGSSRSSAKLEKLRAYGLETGLDATVADLAGAVMEATGKKGVDVLIDSVGGPALGANLRSMALGGRMVSVGRLGCELRRDRPRLPRAAADQADRRDLPHPLEGGAHRLRPALHRRPVVGACGRPAAAGRAPHVPDGRNPGRPRVHGEGRAHRQAGDRDFLKAGAQAPPRKSRMLQSEICGTYVISTSATR